MAFVYIAPGSLSFPMVLVASLWILLGIRVLREGFRRVPSFSQRQKSLTGMLYPQSMNQWPPAAGPLRCRRKRGH